MTTFVAVHGAFLGGWCENRWRPGSKARATWDHDRKEEVE